MKLNNNKLYQLKPMFVGCRYLWYNADFSRRCWIRGKSGC